MKLTVENVIIESDNPQNALTAAIRAMYGFDGDGLRTVAPDLADLKLWATGVVNEQANEEVIRRGILTNQLFFAANVADIGFLVTEWRGEGRPDEPNPIKYYRAHAEAAAYAETSDPTMTPAKMLTIWEAQWNWMRNGFADLNYARRKALERIKLAEDEAAVAAVLAELKW